MEIENRLGVRYKDVIHNAGRNRGCTATSYVRCTIVAVATRVHRLVESGHLLAAVEVAVERPQGRCQTALPSECLAIVLIVIARANVMRKFLASGSECRY